MFEQGYVNIDYQTSSSFLAKVTPLVEKGMQIPIMTWGIFDDNGTSLGIQTFQTYQLFERSIYKVHNEEPSGSAWDAWKAFFIAGFSAQKMVVINKNTDREIIECISQSI